MTGSFSCIQPLSLSALFESSCATVHQKTWSAAVMERPYNNVCTIGRSETASSLNQRAALVRPVHPTRPNSLNHTGRLAGRNGGFFRVLHQTHAHTQH